MNVLARILSVAAAAAALAALGGCATPYHYSQIDGYRYFLAPIETHPVIISKIDGVSTMPGQRPTLVEPGQRMVTVQTYPSHTDHLGEERTFRMDVKPCTHYYLVAVKDNRLNRDFTVRSEYEEPVPGCTPPPVQ